MRRLTGMATLFILLFSAFGCSAKGDGPGTTYYFDSGSGSDQNAGTSKEEPFASLQKANTLELKPGDRLLFKSGSSYQGQLKPQGGGNSEFPVIISKYGGENLPVIHGAGEYQATLHLYNIPYVEVHDLEITNAGENRENRRRGVIIEAENYGTLHHTVLDGLFIHDVNGSLVKSEGGGSAILWRNHGKEVPTRFDSLVIQNCHLKDCARNGINSRGYTNRNSWYPSLNVIVRNNLLEGIPGDGIVPIATDGAVIEYNTMRDCPDILSHKEAAAGIWPWSADNTLIQFNEVSGHKAKWDGQGFDSDWNCFNTTIQYNYSHDNYGGFLLVCNNGGNYKTASNAGTYNTVVRYNISLNDGSRPYETERRGPFSPLFHISGPVEKTMIHHNIIIVTENLGNDLDKTFNRMDNWGGPWPMKTLFAYNTLAFAEPMIYFNGESRESALVANIVKPSLLEIEQEMELPAWAKELLLKHDPEYTHKLMNTFFKEDEEMQELILNAINMQGNISQH